MNAGDRDRLRAELAGAAPDAGISIRFHGSPACAPSVPKRGAGYFGFRTWGRIFVTAAPERPLTVEEFGRFLRAKEAWDSGGGFTVSSGPNGEWPVVED